MDFIKYDLGYVNGGKHVKVTIDIQANVLLLDNINFSHYERGERCSFYGGSYDQSPVIIRVPHSGIWHVAIDLGGGSGRINTTCSVI